jgi:hypothetical protein
MAKARRRDSRRLSAALPPHHDDHHVRAHGHAAHRARSRCRRRSAPRTRPGRRRRLDRVAMPDALHHAGGLPLPGIRPPMVSAQTRQTRGGSTGCASVSIRGKIFHAMEYEAVIGLETHVQLKTKSKMWCGCANAFGAPPNTHVCPVCLGLPGVLPVPNEEALRLTVLTGLLLNCEIPRFAKFDRKNYFYPGHAEELPDHAIRPAVHGQRLSWSLNSTAAFRASASPARTWRRTWARTPFRAQQRRGFQPRRRAAAGNRFRAGPHQRRHGLRISQRAQGHFDLRRRERLRHGKGHGALRRERERAARGTKELGAKIEIKNMNSFSGVRRALEYEIPRQIEVVKKRRQADPIHAPLGRRGGHDRGNAHQGTRARLPLFSRPGPDAARADGCLAGRVKSRVVELPLARKQRFMRDYNCPRPTRKRSRTTCRWEIILKVSQGNRRIPRPSPTGSLTTSGRKWLKVAAEVSRL